MSIHVHDDAVQKAIKAIILLLMICVITGCECKGSMPNSMTGTKPHWPMCGWE